MASGVATVWRLRWFQWGMRFVQRRLVWLEGCWIPRQWRLGWVQLGLRLLLRHPLWLETRSETSLEASSMARG